MIFYNIFKNPMYDQINNMVRWNGISRNKDETVGHHTHIVTFFTRILLEDLFSFLPEEIKNRIIADTVTYAMFHDFDESFTGDILHGFKHNSFNGSDVKASIAAYLDQVQTQNFGSDSVFDKMITKYAFKVEIEKYQKSIVKLADWLSMLYYLSKERQLGNKNIDRQWNGCLRSVSNQAVTVMEEVNQTFKENGLRDKVNMQILVDLLNTDFNE